MSLENAALGGSFKNIAATATTLHKTGSGILKRLTINKMTANAVLTIYDGLDTGGTKIATITMPAALLQSHITMNYNLQFNVGLTIDSTVANCDYTAVWV